MNRFLKQTVGWAAALCVGGIGGWGTAKLIEAYKARNAAGGSCAGSSAAENDGKFFTVAIDGAPFRGPSDAKVSVVAFSDFQCPFSAKAATLLEQVAKKHPEVKVAFKNNPLEMHPTAGMAARAAHAAGTQGKFWEMHDKIFAYTRGGGTARSEGAYSTTLESLARELDLDVARWRRDFDSADTAAWLERERAQTVQLKIQSAPVFFINGIRLSGLQTEDRIETLIAQSSSSSGPPTAGRSMQ